MRLRKKVLVFSASEIGAAPAVFAINTRGMSARAVRTAAEFVEQLEAYAPDVALLFCDGEMTVGPVRGCESAAHGRGISSLAVVRCRSRIDPGCASMTLQREASSMTEILEALRVLSQRKRGPKKAGGLNEQRAVSAGRTAAAAYARLA